MSTTPVSTDLRGTPGIRFPGIPASHWVQSPGWDGFWMFAAIWGSLLLFGLGHTVGWQQATTGLFIGNAFIAVFHSYSTTFMVLGSARMRAARAEHPVKYVVIPLAIVALSMAVGIYTGLTLSFPRTARYGVELWPWVVYLGLFWLGHFFHFGKQDFGVLTLYRSRAGQHDDRSRQVDLAYSLAMMMAIQPIMYVSVGTGTPLGEAFYSFVPITPETMLTVASAAFAFAFAITLGVVCREIIRPNCSIPKLVYYAIMLAHPAVFYFVDTSFKYYFFTTYLWSHWFVAIGLVARINVNGYRASGKTTPRAQLRHWLTIGAIVGLVWWLIGGLDHLAVFSGRDYRQKLAEVTPEQSLFVGIVLGAFLAEQLVHYYCDRHLFRMRDPEIRQAIGPLL